MSHSTSEKLIFSNIHEQKYLRNQIIHIHENTSYILNKKCLYTTVKIQ